MRTQRALANALETARTDVEPQLDRLLRALRPLVPAVVANLAPGLSDSEIAALATRLDVPIPTTLRALWQLHGGQREELDGLWEGLDFVVGNETERCNKRLAKNRANADELRDAGFLDDEIADFRFVVFGNMDHQYLVIHVRSGRVFHWFDNEPEVPRLVAYGLPSLLEAMRKSIEAGEYIVEEGFGEKYLQHARWSWERGWVRVEALPAASARSALASSSDDEGTEDFDAVRRKIRAIEIKAYRRLRMSDDEIVARLVEGGDDAEFVREILASLP